MVLVPITDDCDGNIDTREPMTGGGGDAGNIDSLPAKQKTVQTPGDPQSRLDAELYKILKSKKYGEDDAAKWKEYMQVLQRFLYLNASRNEMSAPPSPPSASSSSSSSGRPPPPPPSVSSSSAATSMAEPTAENQTKLYDAIINSVPQTYRRKAKSLLNYIRDTHGVQDTVKWDDKGRVTINGHFFANSNIIDLVNDAVRARKGVAPRSRAHFITSLRASGIPREFIGNDVLWRMGQSRGGVKRARQATGPTHMEVDLPDDGDVFDDSIIAEDTTGNEYYDDDDDDSNPIVRRREKLSKRRKTKDERVAFAKWIRI